MRRILPLTGWWLSLALCSVMGPLRAQTVALPSPAASSLDRLAQAPPSLSPPPAGWDAYAPQAAQVFPSAPQTGSWAPSALGGQPGYPGYSTAPPSLVPSQGPAPANSSLLSSIPAVPNPMESPTVQQTMRLYQGARGSWAYLYGSGEGTSVGVNELDTTATFAVPFFHNSQANLNHAPLLVTPGFGLQLWDGPQTSNSMQADLPPSTYDLFLDGAWNPQFTPLFGAELGLRVGFYTNWDVFVWESWRLMGRAVGTLQLTPTMQGKAGIAYLDRNQVKLLPVLGVTWVPNPDARYDILFPAPKASRRFRETAKHSLWGFMAGEYGGGAWTFRRMNGFGNTGEITPFDYNDIRITGGCEWIPKTPNGLAGSAEVGYVFYRQLYYVNHSPQSSQIQDLNDTWMLRFSLAY